MRHSFIILLAATGLICACTKDNPQTTEPEILDEIEISQKTAVEIPNSGGTFDITVNSSKQWTLKSPCGWIHHSACYGASGDVVTFTVDENDSATPRSAEVTFVVGKESAKFSVRQGEGATLEINGDDTFRVSHLDNLIEITVSGNAENLSFMATPDNNWCTLAEAESGFGAGTKFTFHISENKTGVSRSTALVFTGDLAVPAKVSVLQEPLPEFVAAKRVYNIGVVEQQIEVEYTSNVKVSANVSENWLEKVSDSDGKFVFRTAASSLKNRSARITFLYDFNPEYQWSVDVNQLSDDAEYAKDFECEQFRNYAVNNGWLIDLGDGRYLVSDAGREATTLDHTASGSEKFTSIVGIENFPALTTVRLNGDAISKCDISALRNVTDFALKGFTMATLSELILGDNKIISFSANGTGVAGQSTSIKVSGKYLESLDLTAAGYYSMYNKLELLDITECPALKTLLAKRGTKARLTIKKKKGQNIDMTYEDGTTVEEVE